MVEGVVLEKKKKEFHDASIQIIRLVDSGHVEQAQELYHLYTNLYYEMLPLLTEEEVSQYYESISQIYTKLKPSLVTEEEVSGESKLHKTDMDTLYELIQNKGEVTLKEIQEKFNIDKKQSDEWATILETSGLIKIKYSLFKGTILKKIK